MCSGVSLIAEAFELVIFRFIPKQKGNNGTKLSGAAVVAGLRDV